MADDFPQGDDETSSTHAEWHTSDYPQGDSGPSGEGPAPPEAGPGEEPESGEESGHDNTDDPTRDSTGTDGQASDDGEGEHGSGAYLNKKTVDAPDRADVAEDRNSETADGSSITHNKKSKTKKSTKSRSKKPKRVVEGGTDQPDVESENGRNSQTDMSAEPADTDNATPIIADVKSPQEPGAEGAPQQNEPQAVNDEGMKEYGFSPQEPQNEASDQQGYGTGAGSDGAYNPYTTQPGFGTPSSPQPGAGNDYGSSAYVQPGSTQFGAQEPYGGGDIGAQDKSKASDYKGLTPAGAEPAAGEPKDGEATRYDYTQQEQGNKIKILVVLGLAVVLVVVLLLLVPHLTSHSGAPSTKSSSTTTVGQNGKNAAPPTTTIPNGSTASKPYDVVITNVDDIFNYTGPSTKNQTKCNYASYSKYLTYSNIVNSSTEFPGSWIAASGACPMTIEGIYADSPGFGVVSVNPSLPITLPPNSNIYFSLTFRSPKGSYDGPLTVLIRED